MLAKRWDIALESERQREVLYIGNRELWIEKENLPPCCQTLIDWIEEGEGEGEDCWTGLTVMRLYRKEGEGDEEDWGFAVMRLHCDKK